MFGRIIDGKQTELTDEEIAYAKSQGFVTIRDNEFV